MKIYLNIFLFILTANIAIGQIVINGLVLHEKTGRPISNVSISTSNKGVVSISDDNGKFELLVDITTDTLVFRCLGFAEYALPVRSKDTKNQIVVKLKENHSTIEEVIVSTGFQTLPKERATGSFQTINSELLDRKVSMDIISKLEGAVPSLQFDRRLAGDVSDRDGTLNLRLRGVSTIYANAQPLIVLDNFPFEGDITNINPNDVESITLLKDAAASSIWGARAGNGVIVITTKSGAKNQPIQVSINSNYSVSSIPDLYYNKNFISARDFIELEKTLFDAGVYTAREADLNKPVLSPVVETLIRLRDNMITPSEAEVYFEQLAKNDIRRDATDYLYRNARNQQNALSISGGGANHSFLISGGYDHNVSQSVGNENQRFTLNGGSDIILTKGVQLSSKIFYVNSRSKNNAIDIRSLPYVMPYLTLSDGNGEPSVFPRDYRESYKNDREKGGLGDWSFRPLQELELNNSDRYGSDLRLSVGLHYRIVPSLTVATHYRYENVGTYGRDLHDQYGYFVRSRVSRYTQDDGARVFPEGDILSQSNSMQKVHNIRGQLNYDSDFSDMHTINGFLGLETSQRRFFSHGSTLYGYDDDVLTAQPVLDYTKYYNTAPFGMNLIPYPAYNLSDQLDRFLSYYGNFAYSYDSRYILSFSSRWDASNLYGVNTNQKGVPLWSTGVSWLLHRENFISKNVFNYLKIRATLGYNGNTDKSSTAFPTATYTVDFNNNFRSAILRTPGNRDLRWERTRIINIGADFSLKNALITGEVDYYIKKSSDLLGEMLIDPTIFWGDGMAQYKVNYADLQSSGFDFSLHSAPLGTTLKWEGRFVFGYAKNRVLSYSDGKDVSPLAFTHGTYNLPIEGNSIDALYSLPWTGLHPETGDPLVDFEGQLSTNYSGYLNSLTLGRLVNHGSSVPLIQGGLSNRFTLGRVSAEVNISFKSNYFFRRPTVSYNLMINNWKIHEDFYDRWQKSGDEANTDIPSLTTEIVANRDLVYSQSEALVEKGDHIRLQNINMSYNFPANRSSTLRNLTLYAYATNLGIVWRANKRGIDPDYPSATILPPPIVSLGLKANF